MGVCNCSMFCCTLLCVRSSIAIILMGKRELVALLKLSSWCLVMVERLFLAVPQGCLRFVVCNFLIILTYYFCNHIDGKRITCCFAEFVSLVSRDCCVALPRVDMDLSAVCDCSIA